MAINKPYRVKTICEFHKLKGLSQPFHPLISVIDYSTIIECIEKVEQTKWVFDYYQISLKRGMGAKLKYGQQQYDFDEGVMFFIAPNQVFGVEPLANNKEKRSGWMLLIHPDFFGNTALAKSIKQYEYFDYSVNEALFLSNKEEAILKDIIKNIEQECSENIDKFSQNIIISQIETLLNYSERFYQRQFITRKKANHQILNRLEDLLSKYFNSDALATKGLPTVQYIAATLNVSPSYLSGLLKELTGQNTQQHIHEKLIEKAKEKLSSTELSVSEIAYEMGFEHPQSFNKLFKVKTNFTPLEFRQSFN
jgi:AraC family transcriptional activator of pobA